MDTNETQRALENRNSTAVGELIRGWGSAIKLEELLREFLPPEYRGTDSAVLALIADILGSFSKTVNALDSERQGQGSHFDRSARSTRRSRCGRRRVHPYECTKVLTKTMDDGYTWRKYGQKEILNLKHPRSYFRCTHKYDKRCPATRQVQIWEQDPSMLEITYIGEHTCRDLHSSSTVADVVVDSNATTTNQNAPPFASSSSSSSAYSSKEASPLTSLVLPDIVGFDQVVLMAQLASFASEVLPGVQSPTNHCSDASFSEELLEIDDILGFDDQFVFF